VRLFHPYSVVSWLSVCYIEDVVTLPLPASCLVRELAFDTVNWCLRYVYGMNLTPLDFIHKAGEY
jgi:hypothetical protein